MNPSQVILIFIIILAAIFSAKTLANGGGNAIDLYNENYLVHGDFIDIGSPDYGFTNKITVCAWVKWNVNPQTYVNNHNEQEGRNADIITIDRHNIKDNGQFWLQHSNTNSKFQWLVQTNSSKKNVQSTTSPSSGIWYYVVGVYDDTDPSFSLKIYVNGILENSDNSLSGNINTYNSLYRMNIGRLPSGYRLFAGELDEIRIYKRALEQDEIRKQMLSAQTIDTTSLLSYWNLNESSKTVVHDYGSMNFSGTFYSALVDVHDSTSIPYYTVSDNDKLWAANFCTGKKLVTVAGNGIGEINWVTSNTQYILTLQNPWVSPPKLDDLGAGTGMTWYGIEDTTETSQWVLSSAPIGEYENFINTQNATSTGQPGSNININITSTPNSTNNLGVYIYGSPSGPPVITGENFPAGIDRRSDVVWGVYEWGSVTANLDINFSDITGIYNSSALKLLRRTRGSVSWIEVSGAVLDSINRIYTVNNTTSFYEYSIGGNSINTLPVTLLYLNSSISENNVYLRWATEIEINNSGFYIERISKDNEWVCSGFIAGNGTTNILHEYFFTDPSVNIGVYKYRIKQEDYNGNFEYFNLANKVIVKTPSVTEVLQNFPNPANPTTRFSFKLSEFSHVTIRIFDISGKEVISLVNSDFDKGYHHIVFDGANFASGIYFNVFEANNTTENYRKVQKLILLK